MKPNQLTILTWNVLNGGRDGTDDRRHQAQVELIRELQPDIFLMQEARGLEAGGAHALHAIEESLDMRGFLAVAARTGQNVAIFIRDPLRPLSFESDSVNFHHALATLKVAIPGSPRALTVISAHLCPNGPAVRRRETAYLAVQADPDTLALLCGDFNSASPHDPEPIDFASLPAHHRARYLGDDLHSADRSILAQLEAAGWQDVVHGLGGSGTPTVPSAGFTNTEFASMRCDYVMASRALAENARSFEIIRNAVTAVASDHYPVMVRFGVPS